MSQKVGTQKVSWSKRGPCKHWDGERCDGGRRGLKFEHGSCGKYHREHRENYWLWCHIIGDCSHYKLDRILGLQGG